MNQLANQEAQDLADDMSLEELQDVVGDLADYLTDLAAAFHAFNVKMGWWPEEGRPVGDLHSLIGSEVFESFEAYRKGDINDDKLPEMKGIDVELGADVLMRVLDYLGARGTDVSDVFRRKLAFNMHRADHKPENRAKPGGKKF